MTNDLFIAGYASRFGEADLSGDIVRRGAFSASLLSRTDPFPMLFSHQTHTPIGIWDRIFEDDVGLFVAGRILDVRSKARRLVEVRAVSGQPSPLFGKRMTRASQSWKPSLPSIRC